MPTLARAALRRCWTALWAAVNGVMPPPLPCVHMSKWSVLSSVSLVPQKHVGGGVPEKGPRPRRMRMFDLQSGLRKVHSGIRGTCSNVSALCS